MKLELKHLASYLPYGLKGINIAFNNVLDIKAVYDYMCIVSGDNYINNTPVQLKNIKPILRPLSDLTKEIEHNGDKFVPIDYFEIGDDDNETFEYDHGNIRLIQDLEYLSVNRYSLDIIFLPYGVIQKLIEWHFDIFGLIENDLAVDINTLNE